MAGDDLDLAVIQTEELGSASAYIAMRSTMEAVSANAVFLIHLIRERVHIAVLRHRLMECGIKHAYLRQTGHQLVDCLYTLQVGRVMKRSKLTHFLECSNHLIVDYYRRSKLLATMHHAMAYCVDFLQVLDSTNLRIGKERENELHALGMLRHIVHDLALLTIREFNLYESVVKTYTLRTSGSNHFLRIHVVKCVLDR